MELTDEFLKLYNEETPEALAQAAEMVLVAPESPETDGLLALMYHEGIGVDVDLEKCFELAEKAVEHHDGLGFLILAVMCENAETPDQLEGGPRQKYDHYDAERFYELCSQTDTVWAEQACLWLGEYYMDMARGGDPEVGAEYYERIAEDNRDAAAALSDYYWGVYTARSSFEPDVKDKPLEDKVYKWTLRAAQGYPEDYSYLMGCIYAEGIGLTKPSLRLAKKYWDDAEVLGDSRATEALRALKNGEL